VYGTLLAVPTGEITFEDERDFVMDAALGKTLHEFKFWGSMTRKPGDPAVQLKEIYRKSLAAVRIMGGGEIPAEKVWEDIVKKLQQKEYTYDVALYGSVSELVQKIAYFFHASLQGCGAYPQAARALRSVVDAGKIQGVLADGQCFTFAQLSKCLAEEDPTISLASLLMPDLRILSHEKRVKKPNAALFQAALQALNKRGIAASEVLHVGSSLTRDLAPAKKLGMKVALYAGDRNSLAATAEQLKMPEYRPDALLTELGQIADLLG
jgi:hypothetical protein